MYVKDFGSGNDAYAGDEGAPDIVDLVSGGAGDDTLDGGQGADTLNGQDDNDVLNGGAGSDILDGGAGDDTAVFSGAVGDYVWSGDRTSATVTGPDGTDSLVNVEHLRFGATVVDLPAPNTAPGAPTDDDGAANTVSESAANGVAVTGLTLGAVDPDAGQTLTWSLLDDAGGRFAINAASGAVTVADASKLNFEVATSHQITVQVSDGTATSSANFTITVTNAAPTAPADADPAANAVSEATANGTAVAGLTIAATDPNGGAITYSLVDDAGGRFAIDATTGVVTVADASLIDYDVATSHQLTVRASDGTASSDSSFTIAVTNVAPTAPVDADTVVNSVVEGAVNGALVGVTASATEAKSGTVSYSLTDDAGGRFAIDPATGVVTVADGSKLNFESAASHQITVRAADAQGAASSQTFSIAVADVAPTTPTDLDAAANTVSEGAANGAVVGVTLAASDVNGGALTYSLLDDADGRFAIDPTTGVVTVADASKLNFETVASHQITVQASDGGATSSASFTIAVTNVAVAAPIDSAAGANTVSESAANGVAVAGLAIIAADPNGGVTYSLVDDAGGRFAINATTGVVTVANAGLLDYETASSHQVTVRATDGTTSADSSFTIDVANAPPTAPVDADTAVNTVSEGAANGAVVGITASATEPKTGSVSYSLSDDAGGRFAIDATTGVVTVADATKLNFEVAASHQITVRATDGQGAFSSQTFTIAVTNVANDAPQDTDAAANTISEGAANGDAVAGLAIIAPDVNGGPLVYSLLDSAGGRFAINAATGVVTVADASKLNFEAATAHQITVQAASGAELATASFTINVTNAAPTAPVDINPAANTVPEAPTNGWVTGITMSAPDPHGGTVTYSLTNNAGGRFAINATTGVVTVVNGALLDHDIQSTHTITVQASDGVLTSSSDVVITLIDKIDSYWAGTSAANTYAVADVQDWQLEGLGGNDTLTGGVGDDIIYGGAGDDILAGGGGNDSFLVAAGEGIDTFDGGAGYDTIKASSDGVTIAIKSMTGIEAVALNGFVNVNISGTTAADTLDFSGVTIPWTPAINGLAGNDTITGTAGNDDIRGDAGTDTLNGGGGNDILDGGADADTLNGGDGADTITGGAANDIMTGGNGDDVFLVGVGAGIDNFDGGAGSDTIRATADNAVITFTAATGMEAISSGGFANVIVSGTTGVDDWNFTGFTISSGIVISMNAGADIVVGSTGADNIRGDAGADTLSGGLGADLLDGGTENDWLLGNDGNDTIIGGAGNDSMEGGNGDDVFLVGVGAGIDAFDGGAGSDTIRATADNTIISFTAAAGMEAISNGGFANVIIGGTTAIDDWNFTGFTISSGIVISMNAGADIVVGSTGADNIRGDAGADTLSGGLGDDLIDGGTENDWLLGNDGNDTIIGGAGDDSIEGGAGADTITGGAGNDGLAGGAGDDLFLIGLSAGADSFDGGAGYDTVRATADNVVISFAAMTGIEAFSNGGFANVSIAGSSGNDDMNFTGVQNTGGMTISGGAGNDTITGTNGVDILKGDAGSDTIYGLGGNDVIDGGAGGDNLYGGDGDDTFLVSADVTLGVDNYDGGAGVDTIQATANNVTMYVGSMNAVEVISSGGFTGVIVGGSSVADDMNFSGKTLIGVVVNGLGGNDTITGGASVDTLRGGDGADTVSGGANNDLLYGDAGADTLNGGDGNDTLDGGADADNLYGGAGDDILLLSPGTGYDGFDGGTGFDEIRATGNVTIAWSSITGVEKINGNGFNVVLAPQYGSVPWTFDFTSYQLEGIGLISGGNGSDNITGSTGNDTFYGAFGADILNGGLGDDVFTYSIIAGSAQWYDTVDGGAGWDKLIATANNAVIQIAAMTSIEEISTGGFSNISFVSSTVADTIDLRNITITGNITIYDLNGGDDTFYGTAGSDLVNGGTGVDTIDTGDGDDIIQMSFNNGWDVVRGGTGYDKIVVLGGGPVNVPFDFQGIEEVQGAGMPETGLSTKIVGTTGDDLIDMRGIVLKSIQYITGDLGNDTIHGSYGNDVIMGDRGFDTIYGESGDDRIYFTAYGDTDVVDGGDGYDTLAAWSQGVIIAVSSMTSIEALDSNGNANVGLAFTDGADNFDITNIAVTGIAYIDLKAGDDIFVGSASADRIIGGLGSDTMTGGAGADIFDYNSHLEGNWDVITDFTSGVDKIDLSTIDAVPVGDQGANGAFTFIGTGSFTGVQGQLRYTVQAGSVVFSGDWNGDGVADFNVTVTGLSSLSASDFVL